MVTLQHLYQLAYNGFRNTSFSPDRRAQQTVNDYERELNEDLKKIPEDRHSWYIEKYTQHLSAWLGSRTRLASSAITGPANFPVARMQKYNNWEQNKYQFFRTWRERVHAAIARRDRKEKREEVGELNVLRKRLGEQEKHHAAMKAVNAIIRSKKPEAEQLEEIMKHGITRTQALELMTGDYLKRKGFPDYALQNSNARMKHTKERIARLEKLEQIGTIEKEVKGVKVVLNGEQNRLQLFFPDKPNDSVRTRLKKSGFRWSPSNACWQAFISTRAKMMSEEIINHYNGDQTN